ncbi:MAG TPA: NlpC/P60 family protein [Jatrophihabitans sp.]|nr:NlpC/P60 family protein [Jatrophihabitans sp.]
MPSSPNRPSLSRARTIVVVLVAALLAAATTMLAGPAAQARPSRQPTSIAQVNAALDRLAKQNEMLDEQYNATVADLAAQRKQARAAQQRAETAAHDARTAHDRFVEALTAQYEAGKMSSTGVLLTSSDPQSYLDGLSTMSYLSQQFADMMRQAEGARTRAHTAAAQAAADLSAARAKAQALHQRRTQLEARTARFEKLLAKLTERQQRRYERARSVAAAKARAAAQAAAARQAQHAPARQPSNNPQPSPHPRPEPRHHHRRPPATSSAAVQRVVDYAIAQVGKGYTFAGTGPDAFDCSGLTMMAWAQAGVHLPHLASAQYNIGRHVSYSQLQPGDLIFLYQPIGHVEIYVGHDLAVSAADPALGVVYVHPSQDMADYVGATRPLG